MAGMHSPSLTGEQLRRLHAAIAPKLRYLTTLQSRMEQKHFPRNDPIYAHVTAAVNELQTVQAKLVELAEKAIL